MSHDPTTDPKLRSFIETDSDHHFPLQNLPFGIFRRPQQPDPRVGVRIGDFVLDLKVLQDRGFFGAAGLPGDLFAAGNLNALMALGRPAWVAVRGLVSSLLRADNPTLRDDGQLREQALLPIASVQMELPARIGDYTDFYSSKEHASNVGTMFRGPENALLPNWTELPVAYHGRSSSIILGGADIVRPCGQVMPERAKRPVHSPSHMLDFELEMGFFVGPGNELGQPIPIGRAREHIFGMVLVNDWSARDVQKWEYQPLGPFTAKNFATSISPWVVTLEALEPFRCPGPPQDPQPLEYLRCSPEWAYDIDLEVWLRGRQMESSRRICLSNFKHLYWNMAQQLAHHTITGCNLRPGDLLASGTISAPDPQGYGSMLELTWKGQRPLIFANGEQRKFLADGDTITMTGHCHGDGYCIGFGAVTSTIQPSPCKRDDE